MGHFYSKNVSTIVKEFLESQGRVSIAQVVETMKIRKETVHAAEGEYTEDYMLGMSAGIIVAGLCHHLTPSLVRPDPQDDEQRARMEGDEGDWDEDDYRIYDSMPWELTEEGRHRMENKMFPVIDYVDV